MNCERVQNLLSAYLDNELTTEEHRLVRAHLVTCAECNCEYEAMSDVKARLSSLESLEVPPGFFEEVSARLQAEETLIASEAPSRPLGFRNVRAGLRSRVWYWPAAAAAVLVMALAIPAVHTEKGSQIIEPDSFFRQHSLISAAQPLADNAVASFYMASVQASGEKRPESLTADRIKLIGQSLDRQR